MNQPPDSSLSRRDLLLMALASAVVTANAYYIHPIISVVAEDFGISDAMIGMVPAFNQIALAVGIFLLLPLGDWFSNRLLVTLFAAGQFTGLVIMALANQYSLFVFGSTLLGFFTIAPYLIPAYVSKRVDPSQLGQATALVTTGIIAGILLARAGAGVIAEHAGWRTVYSIACVLMLAITCMLPIIMQPRQAREARPQGETYFALLRSVFGLARTHPDILVSGVIQALNFGIFLSVWMGIGLHLTSPDMGYGVDTVGYLAGLTIFNLITTPRLGAWADTIGARRARAIVAAVQFVGVCLLFITGHSLVLLILPLIVMNVAGPVIDVTGRMTFLSQEATIRTRLMTVYIVFMFLGGGLASWAGTAAYDLAGWTGNAALAAVMSGTVVVLTIWNMRRLQPD